MDTATQTTLDRPVEPHVSDAELLARQFTTDDPESLDNLCLMVPETDQAPVIEFAYNLTPSKREERPYVRCAHCKYPNHWRGYVMRYPDGRRFLVGKDCGAKIYGADFTLVENRFDEQRTRKGYLRRLGNVRVAFPELLRAVGDILHDHPVFTQYQACRRELHDNLPNLCRQLSLVASRRQGMLAVEERVRDYAAEQRRDEHQKEEQEEVAKLTLTQRKKLRKKGLLPKKDERPIYRTIERHVGRLAGDSLFVSGISPRQAVLECHDRLKAIFREITNRGSENITTTQLRTLVRELGDILDRIDGQLDFLNAVPSFFNPENLLTVAAWASRIPACKGRYHAQGGILLRLPVDDGDSGIRITAPAGYTVPRPDALSVFRLALTQ